METSDKPPTPDTGVLRFYISSTDKSGHQPLYEAIVYAALSFGLSGATVLQGVMGFGSSSIVGSRKLWEMSEKLPLVVEIADSEHKLEAFLQSIGPDLEKAGKGYLVTLSPVRVLYCKKGKKE